MVIELLFVNVLSEPLPWLVTVKFDDGRLASVRFQTLKGAMHYADKVWG